MALLPESFYLRDDVVSIAKELLGKILFTNLNGKITGGIITETEAYCGINDKASHAYNNRRTKRTEVMYQKGGVAYVYLCYGMHHLLNVVTNKKDIPHAVLIRAIWPKVGLEAMEERRKKKIPALLSGPGVVSEALGVSLSQNSFSFRSNAIWIEDHNYTPPTYIQTPRIGVDYAGEDAKLPLRFYFSPPI